MKRKVCESLFAVTLALIVAVTNIPVTAFATEINLSLLDCLLRQNFVQHLPDYPYYFVHFQNSFRSAPHFFAPK